MIHQNGDNVKRANTSQEHLKHKSFARTPPKDNFMYKHKILISTLAEVEQSLSTKERESFVNALVEVTGAFLLGTNPELKEAAKAMLDRLIIEINSYKQMALELSEKTDNTKLAASSKKSADEIEARLIHGTAVKIDAHEFISQGAGCFVNGAIFPVIKNFFEYEDNLVFKGLHPDLLLKSGKGKQVGTSLEFSLKDMLALNEQLVGCSGNKPNNQKLISQRQFHPASETNKDFAERVRLFGSTNFQLGNSPPREYDRNIKFILHPDDTREIKNLVIIPIEDNNVDPANINIIKNYTINNYNDDKQFLQDNNFLELKTTTQYKRRTPKKIKADKKRKRLAFELKTPKEREVDRKRKRISYMTLASTLMHYTLIFYIVPKAPNSPFYLALDKFLNNYLLGSLLPEFSPKFHFSIKVAWCLSLPYQLMLFVIILLVLHIYLIPGGMRISRYVVSDDTFTPKMRLAGTIYMIIGVAACSFVSIFPYAFDFASSSHATYPPSAGIIPFLSLIFYGNTFAEKLWFLFVHIFLIQLLMEILAFNFYYSFLTKENKAKEAQQRFNDVVMLHQNRNNVKRVKTPQDDFMKEHESFLSPLTGVEEALNSLETDANPER